MSGYSNKAQALSIGQKVERIRTFRGFKQEYMAAKLGISQPQFSKVEKQDFIEEPLLKAIADLLQISPDAIAHFNDELITYNINNYGQSIEATEEATGMDETIPAKMYKRITELYERLLASEREKYNLLRSLTN
jgi:transcriptional regulator with XRE-family HTH domain